MIGDTMQFKQSLRRSNRLIKKWWNQVGLFQKTCTNYSNCREYRMLCQDSCCFSLYSQP